MENQLGIKRLGTINFYDQKDAAEAERLSKLLGMKIGYVPSGSDPIYGLESGDVLFIFDGAPKHAALAAQYGNHISEIGLKVLDSRAAVARAATITSQPSRYSE